LKEIEHNYTQNIYKEIHANIDQKLSILSTQLKTLCMDANYAEAEKELGKLSSMSEQFTGIASCTRYVAMYGDNAAYVQQSQENYKKYQAELEKLAANKDELGSVKFKLLQQQEKISTVSTALDKTKQEISVLEVDYEKEQSTLKSAYDLDIKNLSKETGLRKTRQQKERAATYASDKEALSQKHTAALGDYKALQSNQESTLSKLREEEKGLLSQQKSLEEAAKRGNVDQKLLELKRLLGNNYLGEEAWLKLGVQSDQLSSLPAVTEELLSRIKAMQTKGEQPLLVLDLGKSIAEIEKLCKAKGITVLKANGGDAILRAGTCYKATVKDFRWLLLPGSDHGVLPGSRRKSYADQVQYMESNYPGYEVGGARELVTLAMLKQIQDGTVLFPAEPCIYARCKEEYQTGGWKGYRVVLGGCSASGGIVVGCLAVNADGNLGLFCLLVIF
jgi:hypothetical protein